MADRSALVLGGGGITGAAWEIGMLAGLVEAGVDLRLADMVIGTSAGANVGAQVLSGIPIEELFARQLEEPKGEIPVRLGLVTLLRFAGMLVWPGDERKNRARLGRAALRAHTISETTRRRIIASRLPVHAWPDRQFLIIAVDAETGEFLTFNRDSGAELVDAVAASCAAPLAYPPTTINGRRYIDGGTRSGTNADLAVGCNRVVVLAPLNIALKKSHRAVNQVASMGPDIRSIVVTADEPARKAMGRQALDPAFRAPAAIAGRAQAARVANAVAEVWSSAGRLS
jgi:NTE family protein